MISPTSVWFKWLMRVSVTGTAYYAVFELPFPQNHVFLPVRQWKRRMERQWFGWPYDEAAERAAVDAYERSVRERRSARRAELQQQFGVDAEAPPRSSIRHAPRSADEAAQMQAKLRIPPEWRDDKDERP